MLVCVTIMLIAHSANFTSKNYLPSSDTRHHVAMTSLNHDAFSFHAKSYAKSSNVEGNNIDVSYTEVTYTGVKSVEASNLKRSAETQSAPDANTIAQSTTPVAQSCDLSSQDDTPSHRSNLSRSDSSRADVSASESIPCPSSEYADYSGTLDFVPASSSRFISLAQHDIREVKPIYLLAFDFAVEPVPNIVQSPDVDIASDWTLNAISSPARISGWKVSNLQYRFSQQAA